MLWKFSILERQTERSSAYTPLSSYYKVIKQNMHVGLKFNKSFIQSSNINIHCDPTTYNQFMSKLRKSKMFTIVSAAIQKIVQPKHKQAFVCEPNLQCDSCLH